MRIAILGAGAVGRALGTALAAAGHAITYGVRDPASATAHGGALPGKVEQPSAAVVGCEVLILALPYSALQSTLPTLGDLSGRVLVDLSNPVDLGGAEQLLLGHDDSAGEQVARWAPGARVVKAFQQTGAGNMADPVYQGRPIPTFVASDDPSAKQMVSRLASDIGFEPIDAGPLSNARLLESLAMLWIWLAAKGGWGQGFAFQIVRRNGTEGPKADVGATDELRS